MWLPNRFRSLGRIVFISVGLVELGLVAAFAQGQVQNIDAAMASITAANNQLEACVTPIIASSQFTIIERHIPLDPKQPTPEQLSDMSLPDDQQVAAINAINQMSRVCRKAYVSELQAVVPALAETINATFQNFDDLAALLAQKKLSWGDYNKLKLRASADTSKALGVAFPSSQGTTSAPNSATQDQTQVFGITLGAPLSLPTCPDPDFTFDSAGNIQNIAHPECVDNLTKSMVSLASGQKPSWVGYFTITVENGIVEGIEITNRDGIAAQAQIMSELRKKFGPPTESSVVHEENGFGAKFDVIYANWKRADGVISFLGDASITVKSNAFLAREKHEENSKAHL